MKRVLFFALILLTILIFLYGKLLLVKSKIDVKLGLENIKIKAFLQNLSKEDNSLKTIISIRVSNNNNFTIPINNLRVEINKNNELVAKSLNIEENKARVKIPSEGEVTFSHKGEIYLVDQIVNIIKEGISFDYTVSMKVFAIPISFTDTFTLGDE